MTNTPPPTTSQQPPLSNQQQPVIGYGYQYPPQPYGQPTGVPPGQYPPPQQGYYGQPHPPQQGYYGGYQQQYGQPMYQQYPPQQQGYYGLVPPQQPTGNTQPPPTGQPNTVPPQQYPHQQGYYGQTPQQGYYGQQYLPQQLPPQQPYGQPQQPYGQYPPQTGVPQQVVQGQYPPQMQQQPYGQPPQLPPQQPMELPKTIPQKPSPRNLTYQKVARLGEEEDCGEFKFDNLYAMVVHQKRNWLLIPDRRQIHIFDLNTKKNLKSLNCYHLWGSGSMPPTDIDIDYNDDTFYVIADYSLYKLNFEGDLLMKLHSGNREEKGMKITPRYIAVNQSDSSVLCATEGSGTQIIQMMTKDGKGGKVISEDSQGRSRYYCFNSVCYSGYGDQFYIGDSSTIYLIDSTGKILKTHQVEATPQALRVDHYTGCLILSDYHKCIRFVNMEGYSKSFAEEGGTSCCEVSDQLGELYVAFHDRVEIYKSGEAHLVAQAGIRPLPITQAPKVSVSRNMKRSAILGDEEDCGEFKFNGLIAMVVHQTKKHLLVAERLNIQIFDLTTKRHIKTIKVPVGDCSSIYDIDVDYTEDTIVVATTALYKFSYEGDILWKVDYHNREQKGFQFIPRYIAVNQKDSSIMCLSEGCGTQIIQMCTKDGQSGKVISEDSQGRSRYYCFCSVLYSGNEDQFYIGDSNTIYLINSKGRILKTHKAGAHTDAMRLDRATGNILLNDYHNSVRLVNLEGYDKVLVDDVPIQAVDILDQTGELFVGSYDQVFIYKGQ